MAVVAGVLLIGSINIAILLLARGSARSTDAAVQMAVGATRGRIIRGALIESLVLAVLGGALGIGLAYLASGLVAGILPVTFSVSFEPDGTVLAFACALTVSTALLFGLVPALRTGCVDLSQTLKGEQGSSDRSRIRSGLVVTQVAIAGSLAVAAALTAQSFATASAVPLGYDVADRILLSVNLSEQGYSEEQAQVFIRRALEGLRAVPGVRSASTMASVPFDRPPPLLTRRRPPVVPWGASDSTSSFTALAPPTFWTPGREVASRDSVGYLGLQASLRVLRREFSYRASATEGLSPRSESELLLAQISNVVSPDFFTTMGIEVIAGRAIDETDVASGPTALVVSASMAHMFWPDQEPVGLSLLTPDGQVQAEVVGVVEDTRSIGLSSGPESRSYSASAQNYRPGVTFVVHSDVGGGRLRGVLFSLDQGIAVSVRTLREVVGREVDRFRNAALLAGVFGSLALVMAMVGLHGVLSYAVVRARKDIGIRVALGASRQQAGQAVVGRALRLTAIGLLVGGLLTFAGAPLLASFLFEIEARDLGMWTTAAAVVFVVVGASSIMPALRATSVDPMEALRAE